MIERFGDRLSTTRVISAERQLVTRASVKTSFLSFLKFLSFPFLIDSESLTPRDLNLSNKMTLLCIQVFFITIKTLWNFRSFDYKSAVDNCTYLCVVLDLVEASQ